jgi:hypothetical protein
MVCWAIKEAKPFGETVVVLLQRRKLQSHSKRIYSTG